MNINFLTETKDFVTMTMHSGLDITFIGSKDGEYGCTWQEFESLANFDYEPGYGRQQVAKDLVILFSDKTFMSRSEHAGKESWVFNTPIIATEEPKKIVSLFITEEDSDNLRESIQELAEQLPFELPEALKTQVIV